MSNRDEPMDISGEEGEKSPQRESQDSYMEFSSLSSLSSYHPPGFNPNVSTNYPPGLNPNASMASPSSPSPNTTVESTFSGRRRQHGAFGQFVRTPRGSQITSSSESDRTPMATPRGTSRGRGRPRLNRFKSQSRSGSRSSTTTPQTPSVLSPNSDQRPTPQTPTSRPAQQQSSSPSLPPATYTDRHGVYNAKRPERNRPRNPRPDPVPGAERVRQFRARVASALAGERCTAQIMALIRGTLRSYCRILWVYIQALGHNYSRQVYAEFKEMADRYAASQNDDEKKEILAEIETELKEIIKKALLHAGADNPDYYKRLFKIFEQKTQDPDKEDKTMFELLDETLQAWDQVQMLRGLCTDNYGNLVNRMIKQLDKDLKGNQHHSATENALRCLGRLKFHIFEDKDDPRAVLPDGQPLFHTVDDLLPQIHEDFVKKPNATREDSFNEELFSAPSEDGSDRELGPGELDQLRAAEDLPTSCSDSDSGLEDPTLDVEALAAVDKPQADTDELSGPREALINKEIAHILGDDAMVPVENDLHYRALRSSTYIRRCHDCPECPAKEAVVVRTLLQKFLSASFQRKDMGDRNVRAIEKLYTHNEPMLQKMTVVEWLQLYAPCYQGMRSILQRLGEIRTLARCVATIRHFYETCDYSDLKSIIAMEGMPMRIRLEFFFKYTGHIADQHHHEGFILSRWEENFNEFHSSMKQLEIFVCQCCNQYRPEKEIRLFEARQPGIMPPPEIIPYMPSPYPLPEYTNREDMRDLCRLVRSRSPTPTRETPPRDQQAPRRRRRRHQASSQPSQFDSDSEPDNDRNSSQDDIPTQPLNVGGSGKSYGICRTCCRAIKRGKVPADAIINANDNSPIPDCLKNLNYVELMMIQRVRSIYSICVLRGGDNKKTNVRGTSGAMVLVPHNNDATVQHIAETLPSTSNLTIEVSTSYGDKRIVNLPKVLKALKFLKDNNPEYYGINIDEQFRFTLDGDVIFKKQNPTDADAEALINRDENVDEEHLLTQENFVIRPSRESEATNADTRGLIDRYRKVPHPYNPQKISNPYYDVMVAPQHHPDGNNGYTGWNRDYPGNEKRLVKLDISRYVRNRLLNADRRYATDPAWMLFFYHYLLQREMTSVLGIYARVHPAETGPEIAAKINRNDPAFIKANMAASLAKIRGFPHYWKQQKAKLRSSMVAFGPPTWFLTLNPSVRDWRTVSNIYRRVKPRGTNIPSDARGLARMVAQDPVHYTRYFNRRVRTFMSKFLRAGRDEDGPLGNVNHWFHRYEYQEKGLPHIHAILWTKDRPGMDATEQEVTEFLDKYITCRLPDEDTEARLHRRVITHQMHWKQHNKTCLRKRRYGRGGRQMKTMCRFEMPRPVLSTTIITHTNKHVRRLPGIKKRAYYLRRRNTERMINDYNPACLMAWNANMDLQFITHNQEKLFSYAAAYTTKSGPNIQGVFGPDIGGKKGATKDLFDSDDENGKEDGDDQILRANDPSGRLTAMFRQILKMSNQRRVGIFEISDLMLAHKLYEFDCEHIWVNLEKSENRRRMLVAKKFLDTATIPYEANWLDDYYPNRHQAVENYSLFNLMANFEVAERSRVKGLTSTQPEPADGDRDENELADISSDDAIDDDVQEELNRQRARQQIPAGSAQGRNCYQGHYNIEEPLSPFYSHPDIPIGDFIHLTYRGNRNTKVMRKKKAMCLRMYFPYLNWEDKEAVEDFHRRACMLFIPWRNEEELIGTETSYATRWRKWFRELKQQNQPAYYDIKEYMGRQAMLKEEDKDNMERYEKQREQLAAAGINEDDEEAELRDPARRGPPEPTESAEDIAESYGRVVDLDKYQQALASCQKNPDQWRIRNHIHDAIEAQELVKADVAAGNRPPLKDEELEDMQIRLFVSGTAGTGKSFLINLISDGLSLTYVPDKAQREAGLDPAVLLSAPTALAGCNIKGVTIHYLLAIRILKECLKYGMEIPDAVLERKRALLQSVKLIIVDEISMCSSTLFWQINYQLQRILGNSQLFGGINLLVFGDLLQLGPVRARRVWEGVRKDQIEGILGGKHPFKIANLWRTLKYEELTINQRQAGDREFGEIMARARVGQMEKEDHLKLAARIIHTTEPSGFPSREECVQFFIRKYQENSKLLAIFPRNAEVDDFNQTIMARLGIQDQHRLIAQDVLFSSKHQFVKPRADEIPAGIRAKPWLRKEYMIDIPHYDDKMKGPKRTVPRSTYGGELPSYEGGLHLDLKLGVGTRVMLTHNIDSTLGLVNSATATVTNFIMAEEDSSVVAAIEIKLDSNGRVFHVGRCTVTYLLDRANIQKLYEKRRRYQFPFTLCYAATVHKVQGQTLDDVFISTAGMFATGHLFVALSRARTLQGVHLMDYYPDHYKVDPLAIYEYNRLRPSVNLPPIMLPDLARQSAARPQSSRFGATGGIFQAVQSQAETSPERPRLRPRDNRPNYADTPADADSSDESDLVSSGSSATLVSTQSELSLHSHDSIPTDDRGITAADLRELTQHQEAKRTRLTREVETRQPIPLLNPTAMLADGRTIQGSGHLISAVNILNQAVDMAEEIIALRPEQATLPIRELQKILGQEETQTVHHLLQHMPADLRTDPGNPSRDSRALLHDLPRRITNLCAFQEGLKMFCRTCRRKQSNTVPLRNGERRTIFNLDMKHITTRNTTFSDAFKAQMAAYPNTKTADTICEHDGCGGDVMIQRLISFHVEMKYLFVRPLWHYAPLPGIRTGYKTELKGWIKDGMNFLGRDWHLAALIEEEQLGRGKKHYRTWTLAPSQDGGYIIVDDENLIHKQAMTEHLLNRAVFFLFVRKIFIRKTVPETATRIEDPPRSPTPAESDPSSEIRPSPMRKVPPPRPLPPRRPLPPPMRPVAVVSTVPVDAPAEVYQPSAPPQTPVPPQMQQPPAVHLRPAITVDINKDTDAQALIFANADVMDLAADCLINNVTANLVPGKAYGRLVSLRAGPALLEKALKDLHETQLGNSALPRDMVVITDSFNLRSNFKAIIHAATPKLLPDYAITGEQMAVFMSIYYNSFKLASQNGFNSVVTPVIGTGSHLWPKSLATILALLAAMEFYRSHPHTSLKRITFAENRAEIYDNLAEKYLGGDTRWATSMGNQKAYWKLSIKNLVNGHTDKIVEDQSKEAGTKFRELFNAGLVNQPPVHQKIAPAIFYVCNDIFRLNADCAVNAANKQLEPGDGFDRLLRTRAGQEINDATAKKKRQDLKGNPMQYTDAVVTDSYNLKNHFKSIVHVAAPRLSDKTRPPTSQQMADLMTCYMAAFVAADREGYSSIVSPLLGTGLYNWDKKIGTCLAVHTAMIFFRKRRYSLAATNLKSIAFVEKSPSTRDEIVTECFTNKNKWTQITANGDVDNDEDFWKNAIKQLIRGQTDTKLKLLLQQAGSQFEQTLPPTANVPQGDVRRASSDYSPPPLVNNRNVCFANATVQMLLRLWDKDLARLSRAYPLFDHLQRIQQGQLDRVDSIVDTFKGSENVNERGVYEDFSTSEHHDAVEYFAYLKNHHMPKAFMDPFKFDFLVTFRCRTCNKMTTSSTETNEIDHLDIEYRDGVIAYPSFAVLLKNQSVPEVTRPHAPNAAFHNPGCPEANKWCSYIRTQQIVPKESTRYMFIGLPLVEARQVGNEANPVFQPDLMSGRRIPMPENVEIRGHNFRLIAAIEHQRYSGKTGHYLAYIRSVSGTWWCCDDQAITRQSPSSILTNITLLLFEKV